MILIVQKLTGTNRWEYPDTLDNFSDPTEKGGLLYVSYTGSLDTAALSANVSYAVVEFTGSLPNQPEKLVLSKDIIQAMPLGTKRKLENIRDAADYLNPVSAADGDTADLLLAIIQSGNAINVASGNFDTLTAWMVSKSILTAQEVIDLKSGL